MKANCKIVGTSALKPRSQEVRLEVIRGGAHVDSPADTSSIESLLDDFSGVPMAKTAKERVFAGVVGSIGCILFFVFSFCPLA